jgi:hypothetical protein
LRNDQAWNRPIGGPVAREKSDLSRFLRGNVNSWNVTTGGSITVPPGTVPIVTVAIDDTIDVVEIPVKTTLDPNNPGKFKFTGKKSVPITLWSTPSRPIAIVLVTTVLVVPGIGVISVGRPVRTTGRVPPPT